MAALEIRGMEQLMDTLSLYEKEQLMKRAEAGLQEGLDAVAEEAYALCPKDTGALADSIGTRGTMQGDSLLGEVYAAMPYAVYVEMGTQAQPARPFLFPALRAQQDRVFRALAEAASGKREA